MALYNPVYGSTMGSSPFSKENLLPAGLDIDQVAVHTGMNFSIDETPALMMQPDGLLRAIPNRKVLYRPDTMEPLSTVSTGYRVLQPADMLEFYRDLIDAAGYEMSAAGVLMGGRRFWAMARTGSEGGLKDDPLVGYMFLGTAVDGSLATTGFFTTQAMVCWNMSPAIIKNAQQDKTFLKIPHTKEFSIGEAKLELGQGARAFNGFIDNARQLSERTADSDMLFRYFAKVFRPDDIVDAEFKEITHDKIADLADTGRIADALELYNGKGRGANLPTRQGTMWGAYNAVTELLDHHARSRSSENRFHSAVLGEGFKIKQRAMNVALQMAI